MAYLTPEEARDAQVAWVPREGEPADLRDPYHYQTPDEARALGRDWSTQPAFVSGREARSQHPNGGAVAPEGRSRSPQIDTFPSLTQLAGRRASRPSALAALLDASIAQWYAR